MATRQIRFTGAGGQGALLAGLALALAALESGYYATFKGTYSSQVIGGPTLGEVLIDPAKKITYPCTIRGEVEFTLSTANNSFQLYKDGMKNGALAVIDSNLVRPTADDRKILRFIEIPIIQIATDEVGVLKTQSAIALAISVKIIGLLMKLKIDEDVALQSLLSQLTKVSPKVREANKRAFALGLKYAEDAYIKLLNEEAQKK
jgi:2-oxoglutarate ferredoxin oxidoreductase subunit gamma